MRSRRAAGATHRTNTEHITERRSGAAEVCRGGLTGGPVKIKVPLRDGGAPMSYITNQNTLGELVAGLNKSQFFLYLKRLPKKDVIKHMIETR